MKTLFPIMMAVALLTALGCNEGTPGGPGVKKNASSSTSSTATTTAPSPEGTSTAKVETNKPVLPEVGKENNAPAGTDANPVAGDPENTFRLDMPNLGTTIKQGESKVVTIGISRAKNFDQDVTVMFKDMPNGITIEPAEAVIKHGETEAKLTVSAAADAAVNKFSIPVVGHPATGPDATNKLDISVEKP